MKTNFTPAPTAGIQMYEVLLARGNRECLVTVHRGQITKIVPVAREGDVCAGVERPLNGRLVDNSAMFAQLFAKPFGEYSVTVCYGKIVEVAEVVKEEAVKVQDIAPPEQKPSKAAKSPAG